MSSSSYIKTMPKQKAVMFGLEFVSDFEDKNKTFFVI